MTASNNALRDQIGRLYSLARRRPDAGTVIDAGQSFFLGQLGNLANLRANGVQVEEAESQLLADRLDYLERVVGAVEGRCQSLLNPEQFAQPLERSREGQAANVLADIQAAGFQIIADHAGSLEVSPASKLGLLHREALTSLRAEIVAVLRRDVFVVPSEPQAA